MCLAFLAESLSDCLNAHCTHLLHMLRLTVKLQWDLVNMNTVEAKYLLKQNKNDFKLPRHYNTNTVCCR